MQFNVASLLKEQTGAVREYDIDDDVLIEGERRHLQGHVRFDRTPSGVLVRADLRGSAQFECSRCLEPSTQTIDVHFDEEYIPTIDIDTGARVEPAEGEEDAYRIDARHMLDLSEPVRQYWGMELPMAPLCREDCTGLCPECGQPSVQGHRCAPDQADTRWSKLRNLQLG